MRKLNKTVSVGLAVVLILSSFISAFATSLNINTYDGVETVETDEEKFFNIPFVDSDYIPSAEQTYSMVMGENLEFWRYSSGLWGTPWGMHNDNWIKELMDGNISELTTINQNIPEEVQAYLQNGGSWDNIKVSFQCVNTDGIYLKPSAIFRDGNVDAKLKWGTEFELSFYPVFHTDTENYIFDGNKVRLNRGVYPYSYTLFSMWGNSNSSRHYGAVRVWDEAADEPTAKYDGYSLLRYSDILNSNGDISRDLWLKNLEYFKRFTETGQKSEEHIDSNYTRIGNGTFRNGGATGIGFSFPIKVIFEINPTQQRNNVKLLSETGLVNIQDIDNTISNIQFYADRDGFVFLSHNVDMENMVSKLRNDSEFRERVITALTNENEGHVDKEFVSDLVNRFLVLPNLTDEVAYSYFRDITFTSDTEGLKLNRNLRSILNTAITLLLADVWSTDGWFNPDYLNVNAAQDNSLESLLGDKIIVNESGVFDINIAVNGNLKNFIRQSQDFKALYSLPTVFYNYNNKVIKEDSIRAYTTALTHQLATEIKDFDTNLFTFVSEPNALVGTVVDGVKGYYTLNEDYFESYLQEVNQQIAAYPVKRINGISRVGDTGALTDDTEKLISTDNITPENLSNNVKDMLPLLMTANLDYTGIKISEGTTEDSYTYDGVLSYSGAISDKGCPVSFDMVFMNGDETRTIIDDFGLGVANRYEPFTALQDILTDDKAIQVSYKGQDLKPMVVAYADGKTEAEIDNIVKEFIGGRVKIPDGTVEYKGVTLSCGDSIRNAVIYPTSEQLANQSDINVRVYVRNIQPVKVAVVYVNSDDEYIRTRVGEGIVEDGKVWVCVLPEEEATFEICAGFVSTDIPPQGISESLTWEAIAAGTEPADGQWLNEVGFISVDGLEEPIIYAKAAEKEIRNYPVVGDFVLGQQRISKSFNTMSVYAPNLKTAGKFNFSNHSIRKTRYYYRNGRRYRSYYYVDCVINNTSKDTYKIDWAVWDDADSRTKVGAYGKTVTDNTTGAKKINRSGKTSDRVNPNMKFSLWRGYDKPVAAAYANTGYNDEVWRDYGIGSGIIWNSDGAWSNYVRNIRLNYGVDTSSSDQEVTFACNASNGGHTGKVNGDSDSKDVKLAVNVFIGSKSPQTAQSIGAASNDFNGITLSQVDKQAVQQNTIEFYPTVNMKFEDRNGQIKDLNVLSKYKSSITPVSTVEVGYRAGSNDSLNIVSDMWSRHKRALDAHGQNSTLAGGTNYRLLNNNYGLPVVGIKTYQMYVPDTSRDATAVIGWGNGSQSVIDNHSAAVQTLKNSVTGKPINQKIVANGATYTPSKGGTAPWLNNMPFETDAKYWFGHKNVVTSISNENTTTKWYKITSDTDGNVYLSSADGVITFTKYQDNNYIMNHLNNEWRDVNNKTGIVSTYIDVILRNQGNDTEFVADGRWYNEAFPGLAALVSTTTMNVELNPEVVGLVNIVNMRYTADAQHSVGDAYKKFNQTWFMAEPLNLTATLTTGKSSVSAGVNNCTLNLRTKDWFIPNATVYDND